MKLIKVKINNFRLLENVVINIDSMTTSIVGKNNTGKTSFSKIFDIFINDRNFLFDDFSLNTHVVFNRIVNIFEKINSGNEEKITNWISKVIPKISLLLEIEIDKSDTWSNVKPFIVGFSSLNEIKIQFEFKPSDTTKLLKEVVEKKKELVKEGNFISSVEIFRHLFKEFYHTEIEPYSETEITKPVSIKDVQKLLQCNFIYAQRAVEDSHSDKASKLSNVFEYQYKNSKQNDNDLTKGLTSTIENTSNEINTKLKEFFNDFITSFSEFGFPNIDKEELELKSDLKVEKLFKNDVKLFYKHGLKSLPENYNGLGYSNLIYIISKIIGFHEIFNDSKANLCLVFIEEPEAHMHPQMQSIFIKKINSFLIKRGFNVQLILTTHSSHIISNSNFDSIRYFTTKNRKAVIKDLMKFNPTNGKSETLRFLKQYLTLGNADLFFADKAILFEGVVERLLMPVFTKKLDIENKTSLTENYISFIEVGGAYANKFKELLEFLELKTLIITDIDSVKIVEKEDRNGTKRKNEIKTEVTDNDELLTSNTVLKKWIPSKSKINELLTIDEKGKIENNIRIAYQINVISKGVKCGRSFEEAFIIDNSKYIFENKDTLKSIQHTVKDYVNKDEIFDNSYSISDFINRNNKKTDFAFDLLTVKQDNWNIPTYIKDGLEWLAQ